MKKKNIWLLIMALTLFIIGGVHMAAQKGQDILINQEKTFNVNGINQINVDVGFIDVRFNPVEAGTIKVSLKGKVSTNDSIPEFTINNENGKITVQMKNKQIPKESFYKDTLKLYIDIPKTYSESITINSTAGDAFLSDLNSKEFYFKSANGDLVLNHFTVSDLNVETKAGDINIKDFSGNTKIKSASGDIYLQNRLLNHDINIETSDGKVTLKLPGSSEFYLKVTTKFGDIHNQFPIKNSSTKEEQLEGIVGSGKNKVEIATVTGDVSISK